MSVKVSFGIAAAMTLLLSASTLVAQSNGDRPGGVSGNEAQNQQPKSPLKMASELEEQSRRYLEEESWVRYYATNSKLHQLRPYEQKYMVNIIRASARVNRLTTAYHFMLKMQQQGMTYDFNALEDTVSIRDTEAYEYINDLLISAGKPAGDSSVTFRSEGAPGNFQAMAWDPLRDRLLVGTRRKGAIMALGAGGEAEVLIQADDNNGLWSIGGLAVDAQNKRLWVASYASPEFEGYTTGDRNKGALFELDLESMAVRGRYPLPDDKLLHQLGSVAATEDGHVYVINRAAPIVYLRAPGSDELAPFFASPELMALSDVTVTPDNSRVFISDTYRGVRVIDPVAQQASWIGGPEALNLGRINGMQYQNGNLFVVQGGFNPQRLMRLELDGTGAAVQSVIPMVIAREEFDQPGSAALSDENIYYFANQGAANGRELIVMSTPLDAGVMVAPPDMGQFEKALRSNQQQSQD